MKLLCMFVLTILLYVSISRLEGFADRCGVDLPSCSGLRCINGYCKSDVAPVLPRTTLPLAYQ